MCWLDTSPRLFISTYALWQTSWAQLWPAISFYPSGAQGVQKFIWKPSNQKLPQGTLVKNVGLDSQSCSQTTKAMLSLEKSLLLESGSSRAQVGGRGGAGKEILPCDPFLFKKNVNSLLKSWHWVSIQLIKLSNLQCHLEKTDTEVFSGRRRPYVLGPLGESSQTETMICFILLTLEIPILLPSTHPNLNHLPKLSWKPTASKGHCKECTLQTLT